MIRWWKIPPSLSQAWSRRCNTLPHHSSSRSTQLQEDSTSVSCADRERVHQFVLWFSKTQIYGDWEGDWRFRHLGYSYHCPIYILGEFQSIWRPPSSGPNQLGFQSSSGAPHSVGNSDLQRLRGRLEIQAPGLFLSLPDLYSCRVSENLEAIFIRAEPARAQSSSGAAHSVGNSDLQRLRGILEIQAPGLFLPSPDLSVGIFIRVIGNF